MEPLALSIDEAAKALSIGKTKLYSEIAANRIQIIKLGKRSLIKRDTLKNYLDSLEAYPSQSKEG